jgi:hypothetical protein
MPNAKRYWYAEVYSDPESPSVSTTSPDSSKVLD